MEDSTKKPPIKKGAPLPSNDALPNKSVNNSTSSADRGKILNHLRSVGPLTTLFAREHLGVMHPGGRIKELRDQGHNIVLSWKTERDASGRNHRVGRYALLLVESEP